MLQSLNVMNLHDIKLYINGAKDNPLATVAFTVLSIALAALYTLYKDFAQTFLPKPSHFVDAGRWGWGPNRQPEVNAPLVEERPGESYRDVLARGSKLYPDRTYKIRHFPGEIVIVPHKCVEEIKNAPETKLSFQQGSYDFFLGVHTGITGHELAMATLIRRDVGRLLDRVYGVVEDEAYNAVMNQIGPCKDWTEIVLLPRIVRMIVMISQRVFVGEPLCRDERWIETITNCTGGAFNSVTKLWRYNWFIRPIMAWRMPELRRVRDHKEEAARLLEPVIRKRLRDMEDPKFDSPPDLIQLVIDGIKDGKGRTLDYQVTAQIGTGRAALFTTGVTVFHLLYDLAIRPEYIEPLREEVKTLGDVPMNRANVSKLVKMDSFIRECQRWSKFMLVGTIRKVAKPMTLSDGTHLPVGAVCGMDTQNSVFNHSTLDSSDKFDGFRFARLRAEEGNTQKYQAVMTSADHLVYGYGTQACPGRFFAVHEAKVVLARILKNYDFKLKDRPGTHPMSRADGILTKVDPTIKFLFKKRTDIKAKT